MSVICDERADLFIVLGFQPHCATNTCLRLAQSSDGGRAFTPLAVPKDVPGAVNDPTMSTVMDVRFGSAIGRLALR